MGKSLSVSAKIMEPQIENYGNIIFTRIDGINNPDSRLIMTKELLKDYNWYMSFGTCLGFHRDKDFIPEDTDIDISVFADSIDVESIIRKFKEHFFYLRSVKHNGKQHQSAFIDEDGFIIDLQFYYKDGEKYVSYCEGGKWEDNVSIEIRGTKYGLFPFPKETEEYLERRYGNWKVKSTDKSIKQ